MVDNELRHRMTATEFANRQLNEIERLRELVEEAYHEGFKDGRDKGDKENTFWAWSESKVIEKLEE